MAVTETKAAAPQAAPSEAMAALRRQYGCGPVELTGDADVLYERHLLFDNVVDPAATRPRQRYEAAALRPGTTQGQGLRFVQEYFLVACSLADLVRRFRRTNADWSALPDKVAIQLNDTHPAIADQPEMRAALDLIFSDHFSGNEPGVFAPLRDVLLTRGDYYMHLADLASYLDAGRSLCALYADPDAWARTAILNVASSGKFSSDRTIAEYAADIWHAAPCPVS